MLLNGSKDNLEKIAVALGFCNATQFGTFFNKHTGQTPMEYRNGKEIPLGEAEGK
jgi:transcriptional regulator GlxA family with amidase domain